MTEIEEPVSTGERAPREGWAPGPWDSEDDKYEWRHLGFPCLIVRGPPEIGALCGYVGVAVGHPWHGLTTAKIDGDEGAPISMEAHGGITYAGACHGDICHVPRPGEPDDVWWLGFDCAHYHDVCPGMEATLRQVRRLSEKIEKIRPLGEMIITGASHNFSPDSVYRDVRYVAREVRNLAKQAHVACHPRRFDFSGGI